MDTFIVRIYRSVARGTDEPAGTVEHVESGERVGFSDAHQLLSRLLAEHPHVGPVRRGGAPGSADDQSGQDA